MCRAHIALQELQAVAMMLCKIAFWLSSEVVALHLDNCTAKVYLCNQGGRVSQGVTVSPFLSRLACQILRSTDMLSITIIPGHIPTKPIIISTLGSTRSESVGIFMFHVVSAVLCL